MYRNRLYQTPLKCSGLGIQHELRTATIARYHLESIFILLGMLLNPFTVHDR
ncbi:hypothetical protein D3C76_1219270 [compost metagenome]